MIDFSTLIPELRLWNNAKGIEVESWINGIGSFEHAIAYSVIFWPDFVEYEGCIFFAHSFDYDHYKDWIAKLRNDKTAVEKVVNHRHILDYFPNGPTPGKELRHFFGLRLKELWETKLCKEFPDRDFVFELYDDESLDYNDAQITFYQIRKN